MTSYFERELYEIKEELADLLYEHEETGDMLLALENRLHKLEREIKSPNIFDIPLIVDPTLQSPFPGWEDFAVYPQNEKR